MILYHKRTVSLFMLTPVLKDLFHHIKYYRKQWLLKLFSPYIKEKAAVLLADVKFDNIIPIPLSGMRMFQRGFNQALIIANMLARMTEKPVLTNIVQRRCGAAQSRLTRNQRLTNQRGTFIIRRADLIENKAILIVDDIYTTGSTVNECARILKEHGARSVSVFTVARTI
jgi:ComF family protein